METRVKGTPDEDDLEKLITTRNAIHHALLSLPPSTASAGPASETTEGIKYEMCRIAAIIYSTAVLFGLPADSGWHLPLLDRLTLCVESLPEDPHENLVIWALCIGALTSSELSARGGFEDRLRGAIADRQLASWSDVEAILEGFLWSASA